MRAGGSGANNVNKVATAAEAEAAAEAESFSSFRSAGHRRTHSNTVSGKEVILPRQNLAEGEQGFLI